MGFWEGILARVAASIAEKVYTLVEARLDDYMEKRSKIKAISTEADQLKEELKGATTDAERIQILRKLSNFTDRIGN